MSTTNTPSFIYNTLSETNVTDVISYEDFNRFLDKLLSNNSIDTINEFLNSLYSNYNENNKNLYQYLMFLLYFEKISFNNLSDYLQEEKYKDVKKACEILLGRLPKEENNVNNNLVLGMTYNQIFVRDLIVDIYYGKKEILCYKDLDNIKSEFNRIWNELLTTEEREIVRQLMNTFETTPEDFYKFFVRINGENAGCENIIESLSYILNYDTTNIFTNDEFDTFWKIDIDFINIEDENKKEILEKNKNGLLSILKKIKAATINY